MTGQGADPLVVEVTELVRVHGDGVLAVLVNNAAGSGSDIGIVYK